MVLFLHKHCILCVPFKFMWCKVEGAPSPHSHNNGDGHMVSTTTTSDDASLPLFPPPILLLRAALLPNSSSLRSSSNIAAIQDSSLRYAHHLEPTPPSVIFAIIIGALLGATHHVKEVNPSRRDRSVEISSLECSCHQVFSPNRATSIVRQTLRPGSFRRTCTAKCYLVL